MRRSERVAVACVVLAGAASGLADVAAAHRGSEDPDPAQVEFFERRIRPLFAEHCYECHSDRKNPPRGRLRLDTPEHIRKGGRTDELYVPGTPSESLLVRAVSYADLDLRMPPDGKLTDSEIHDLEAWIAMGAPLPAVTASASAADPEPGIDLEEGRRFWAFQPVSDPLPPAVENTGWPRTAIDHFVLAELERRGLSPAPPADRTSWLRRVSFDLIGLPPRPEDITAFEADDRPDAHERVVEQLLGSPHYGERWGRHWLDLVRFAETNGHEFDNDKLDAWRYRDYVIRAFNQDVPYDQLVREHIAGDLIPDKRRTPDGSHWDSPLGTGFYWFGEVLNSPVDSVKSRADEVDNQLDVIGKAFLGLTVACARCHDHKFDPIPTVDYYALGGILHSTAISESVMDSPGRIAEIDRHHEEVAAANAEIAALLKRVRPSLPGLLASALLEAARRPAPPMADGEGEEAEGEEAEGEEETAGALDQAEDTPTRAWEETLALARGRPAHPLHPLAAVRDLVSGPDPFTVGEAVAAVAARLRDEAAGFADPGGPAAERGDETFADFERLDYGDWIAAGRAFGDAPTRRIPPNQPLRDHRGNGIASSFGRGSDALVGSLTSPEFTMVKPWVHVRLAGSEEERQAERARLRVSIVAAGYKAVHFRPTGEGAFTWQSQRVEELVAGRRCVIEIVDRARDGHIAVDAIVFSDSPEPPPLSSAPNSRVMRLLDGPGLGSMADLVAVYRGLFEEAARSTAEDHESRWLVSALVPFRLAEQALQHLPGADRERLAGLVARRSRASRELPPSAFALVAREGTPGDVRLHVAGNHKNLGDVAGRGFLQVIAGREQPPVGRGSGRLALAARIASPENPLTARVMVNRIWQHHFGRGLVASADNFGVMGRRPSHPDLLDHLASAFVKGGWSIKDLHRRLVLSSTYRMSSRADPAALESDPDGVWLHHYPVRRLEAEAIRDAILSVSGSLDRRLYGPSVTPHISEFQDGRGKPESGPLDGDRRRSIYIQVRRNFLTPLFLAFDYPLPISTLGMRSRSTVPSQALSLLNNGFVAGQARLWGERVVAAGGAPEARVEGMFVRAFGRPPEAWEGEAALAFLRQQRERYGSAAGSGDARPWADLGHVLFNAAEFVFLR